MLVNIFFFLHKAAQILSLNDPLWTIFRQRFFYGGFPNEYSNYYSIDIGTCMNVKKNIWIFKNFSLLLRIFQIVSVRLDFGHLTPSLILTKSIDDESYSRRMR